MSLHQLVANALWKFGKRPAWLSIFPSSLQLCCVKSQTRRLVWGVEMQLLLLLLACFVLLWSSSIIVLLGVCLHSLAPCNFSEVIMWQLFCLYTRLQHMHSLCSHSAALRDTGVLKISWGLNFITWFVNSVCVCCGGFSGVSWSRWERSPPGLTLISVAAITD